MARKRDEYGTFIDGNRPDETAQREIDAVYDRFWKEIVENEAGELDLESIKCELFDYYNFMVEVSLVYSHVSGGLISKCNTRADAVIDAADESYSRQIGEEE